LTACGISNGVARVRDYNEVAQRLSKLPRRQLRVERVGKVWGYSFFRIQRVVANDAPTVLLTGGMHGEEPAGVEGVLRWLESGVWDNWRLNWFVLPCINPYGWERNQRTNAQRRDVNRQFRNSSDCPEAELIKRIVRGRKFLFSMEFHEDVGASGYYLYELRSEPPFIGEHIVEAVAKHVPINRDRVIDGNRATKHGLIRRDASEYAFQKRRRWPMAFHLFMNCTAHVLGSETPVHVSLPVRAAAHVTALETALTHSSLEPL
jgi:protein MpaA